jgi:Flp pilus assembly protein TadG
VKSFGPARYRAGPGKARGRLPGQAFLEFLVLLPFIFFLFLGLIQFGLLVYAKALVTGAAQEGARVASQADRSPADGELAAREHLRAGLNLENVAVRGEAENNRVYLEVSAGLPAFFPLAGKFIRFELYARSDMLKEGWLP